MEIAGVFRWVSFPVPTALPPFTRGERSRLESEREIQEFIGSSPSRVRYRWLSASAGYFPVINSVDVSNRQHLLLAVAKRAVADSVV